MFSEPFTQCLPGSLLLASIVVSLSPPGVRADDTGADTSALASVRRVSTAVDVQRAWTWTQNPHRACGAEASEAFAAPVCGNGVVEHGETCDDGNTMNGDGSRKDGRSRSGNSGRLPKV